MSRAWRGKSTLLYRFARLPIVLILIALFVFLIALLSLVNQVSLPRFDLTEEGLYTLSPGTKNVLAEIDEPIQLELYYSVQMAEKNPILSTYISRVKELLQAYERAAPMAKSMWSSLR